MLPVKRLLIIHVNIPSLLCSLFFRNGVVHADGTWQNPAHYQIMVYEGTVQSNVSVHAALGNFTCCWPRRYSNDETTFVIDFVSWTLILCTFSPFAA